jgi:hypothetical protein
MGTHWEQGKKSYFPKLFVKSDNDHWWFFPCPRVLSTQEVVISNYLLLNPLLFGQ